MRILVDANHPAHVHLFRNAAREWISRGHRVLWTARDKDLVLDLLRQYGFDFRVLSAYRSGLSRMALDLMVRDWKLYRLVRTWEPDVMVGTSVNITHVSRVTPARSIFFTESDPHLIRLITYLSFPFADRIVTPDALGEVWPRKHVTYPSYHKLAYLHPNRFTPDPSVLHELGIEPGSRFFILRFISWGASHDIGQGGLSLAAQHRIVEALSGHGRVFVSVEKARSGATSPAPDLEPYHIQIDPHRMHDALHYATLLVGDSQSMTTEAALLGTPSLRCNSMVGRTAVIEQLEHQYDLTYGFRPHELDRLIAKIEELLQNDNLKARWLRKRDRLLEDKIDLTSWMVGFVEQYLSHHNLQGDK